LSGSHFVILSGCSGGGKSTLLSELAQRGWPTVEEPGRRIIAEGGPLPWDDPAAFARRAMAVALADRDRHRDAESWVFFDRGLIDAAVALQHLTGEPALSSLCDEHHYHRRVFLTPPWPDIYARDGERRHDLAEGVAEYERLLRAYPAIGYEPHIIPRLPVEQRADFILDVLNSAAA
jgi:predicted ATPase